MTWIMGGTFGISIAEQSPKPYFFKESMEGILGESR